MIHCECISQGKLCMNEGSHPKALFGKEVGMSAVRPKTSGYETTMGIIGSPSETCSDPLFGRVVVLSLCDNFSVDLGLLCKEIVLESLIRVLLVVRCEFPCEDKNGERREIYVGVFENVGTLVDCDDFGWNAQTHEEDVLDYGYCW